MQAVALIYPELVLHYLCAYTPGTNLNSIWGGASFEISIKTCAGEQMTQEELAHCTELSAIIAYQLLSLNNPREISLSP